LAKASLKLPSRIAHLSIDSRSGIKDASWSVAYGLTILGIGNDDTADQGLAKSGGIMAKKLGGWFKQFLP